MGTHFGRHARAKWSCFSLRHASLKFDHRTDWRAEGEYWSVDQESASGTRPVRKKVSPTSIRPEQFSRPILAGEPPALLIGPLVTQTSCRTLPPLVSGMSAGTRGHASRFTTCSILTSTPRGSRRQLGKLPTLQLSPLGTLRDPRSASVGIATTLQGF